MLRESKQFATLQVGRVWERTWRVRVGEGDSCLFMEHLKFIGYEHLLLL